MQFAILGFKYISEHSLYINYIHKIFYLVFIASNYSPVNWELGEIDFKSFD